MPSLDHHCPWVGNCIGKRNRRLFIIFLLFGTLGCLSAAYTSAYFYYEYADVASDIDRYWAIGITLFYTTIAVCLFGLLISQSLMICLALTTYEHLKAMYKDIANPFNDGCMSNCLNFWNIKKGERNITKNYEAYLQ